MLVDLPLDETPNPRRICRVRWHVALKEMLRKRALVAGRPFNPIPMLIVIGVLWLLYDVRMDLCSVNSAGTSAQSCP